jgi:hydroxymethylbilane synthase
LIRVGTRGSALALAQAFWVAERLDARSELVAITTTGDRRAPLADKSRWVSELERALLDKEIDVAVHSAKDVPAELAPGLCIAAIPARADPRDAICGAASLDALAPGARIGTSSLRRAAQIRAARDDLELVEIRGNVDTRLRKLAAGEADALVLARAGLERLGRLDEAGGTLDELVPAAGQGALLIEARSAESLPLDGLGDPAATACVRAERELTARLGASCNTPVGALASPVSGERFELRAWVGLPDGSQWVADRLCGAREDLGSDVAERMLSVGAGELLRRAEQEPAR